ncbi:MAG: sugar ABC transporter permease [Ruminococcaceae bacterium]|nr:sugar ABC transporter permease [Oscillospiraceae bacterium]
MANTKKINRQLHSGKNASWLKKDLKQNYALYLLLIPILAFYVYFHYKPMYGLLASFQDYSIRRGISGSEWVGFENYERFFNDPYFSRNIINTIRISLYSLIFGFPAPIILALLMNELTKPRFKKTVQTITYLPHFISLVVICGMVTNYVAADGFITKIVSALTGKNIEESLLNDASMFVPIYIVSDIWREIGWGSIIYLAALAGVDQELYEAASIDGAGRLRQTWSITLPSIAPTIITLLILRMGSLISVGYEKIILLTNPYNAETSEILSYYIYKRGIEGAEYGLSTAAGLFNSVINCVLVLLTNWISRRVSETSLW